MQHVKRRLGRMPHLPKVSCIIAISCAFGVSSIPLMPMASAKYQPSASRLTYTWATFARVLGSGFGLTNRSTKPAW